MDKCKLFLLILLVEYGTPWSEKTGIILSLIQLNLKATR